MLPIGATAASALLRGTLVATPPVEPESASVLRQVELWSFLVPANPDSKSRRRGVIGDFFPAAAPVPRSPQELNRLMIWFSARGAGARYRHFVRREVVSVR